MKNIRKLILSLSVTSIFTLASQVQAESLNGNQVGVRAGLIDVEHVGSAFGAGVYGDVKLTDGLSFRPSIDYWKKSVSEDFGFSKVETTLSDIALGGALKYGFSVPGSSIEPYVLGGLAMHRLSAEAKVKGGLYDEGSARLSGSETKTGFDLGAGASFQISDAVAIIGEVMMRNVDELNLTSVTGGLSYRM